MILARYVLVIGSESDVADVSVADHWDMTDARLLADLPAMLEAAQEDLQDLMPEGYRVTIEREE